MTRALNNKVENVILWSLYNHQGQIIIPASEKQNSLMRGVQLLHQDLSSIYTKNSQLLKKLYFCVGGEFGIKQVAEGHVTTV